MRGEGCAMTIDHGLQRITFTAYQQTLIDQLIKEAGPGSAHRLVAPVGAGKSFGIAGAVAALVKVGRVSRVLVLLPTALREHWTVLLERFGTEGVKLDGRSIRVMRNEYAHGIGWPKGVFTVSIDLAKRENVREWISALPWDFVVIDEAHNLTGQRQELVRLLLTTHSPPGVLLTTAFDSEDKHNWVGKTVGIDWHKAVEKYQEPKHTDALLTRPYRRAVEEVTLVNEVMAIANRLGPLKGMILLRLAASSILCLEESLTRQVSEARTDSGEFQLLNPLLDSVESLPKDSKLDCLKELVSELSHSGIQHTVLFCDYNITLNYLCSAIRGLNLVNHAIHGNMTTEARNNAFSQFQEEGGFLVTTTAASQFLTMSFVQAVVHYDLPLSQRAFAERVGRYDRYGRTTPFTSYCFEDETRAFPIEANQLQIARALDSKSIEEDTDIDTLFKKVLR